MNREYVDLGLSVKWATMNIGAERITDHGSYFAWGETGNKTSIKLLLSFVAFLASNLWIIGKGVSKGSAD